MALAAGFGPCQPELEVDLYFQSLGLANLVSPHEPDMRLSRLKYHTACIVANFQYLLPVARLGVPAPIVTNGGNIVGP